MDTCSIQCNQNSRFYHLACLVTKMYRVLLCRMFECVFGSSVEFDRIQDSIPECGQQPNTHNQFPNIIYTSPSTKYGTQELISPPKSSKHKLVGVYNFDDTVSESATKPIARSIKDSTKPISKITNTLSFYFSRIGMFCFQSILSFLGWYLSGWYLSYLSFYVNHYSTFS